MGASISKLRQLLLGAFCLCAISIPGQADISDTKIEPASLDSLREQYVLPQSKFVTVEDVAVHYMDQGSGPVVLLLHGSYLDLTSWDDWVKALETDHRVIRLDRLRFGLTGTFQGQPVDYAREHKLLNSFINKLGLTEFSLVGASSGGIVAAAYAAQNPDKIQNLILMNVPVAHGRIQNTRTVASDPLERITIAFEKNLVQRDKVDEEKVNRYKALHLRHDPDRAVDNAYDRAAAFSEQDRLEMFKKITARTLILWSEENRTLSLADSQRIFNALPSSHKYFATISEAGHMVPLEMGPETAAAGRAFLTGSEPPKQIQKNSD